MENVEIVGQSQDLAEAKMTSRKRSGIQYASSNISPYLCYYSINKYVYSLFYTSFYVHIIWISNIPCSTIGRSMHAYMH
jgi:hypothetical protein